MPELPEVETMRRAAAQAVGSRIEAVELYPCPRKPITLVPSIKPFHRRAAGTRIVAAERAGKRVVLVLDSGDRIVIEPRMTGLVLLADPPDPMYLRLRLRLSGGRVPELAYWDRRGLGHVRLVSPKQFAAAFGERNLGPDALMLTGDGFRERLGRTRRAIKVALLDQRAVAGIGNLYAVEILHVAGIHPQRRCADMTARQWQALAAANRLVLEEAIRCEGSTLGDGTYRNALSQAGGYQNAHRVYDKEGQPCRRCRTAIVRIVQAQRSTFFCPGCQTKRGWQAVG